MNEFSVKLGDLLAKSNVTVSQKSESKSKERVPKVIKAKEKHVSKETNTNNKKIKEVSMTTKGAVNIQDQFLNHMRREKAPVTVHLLDGKEIHGHIKSFDNFCIQLEAGTHSDILVYKHGISSITPSKVSDYTKQA